ncbi:hypothetical protein BZA77DRAFT_323502 [Pyronema omphalodes]|nr:hypothetical protein BZA77DRAFT_323502 [Pyronema omphalodes]
MSSKRKETEISDSQQPWMENRGFITFHCDTPQVMLQPALSSVSRAPFAFTSPTPASPASSAFPTATGQLSIIPVDPACPEPKKIKKGGRLSGSQNFKDADKKRAFAVIRKILPCGSDMTMWEEVARQYSKEAKEHGRKERDAGFLKRFFMGKIKEGKGKSTGSLNIPWDVAEARDIRAGIEGDIHMGSPNDATVESASEWEEDRDDDDGEDLDDAEDDGLENDSETQHTGRLNGSMMPILKMPKTTATRSVSPVKVKMLMEQSSRQTDNDEICSKASLLLDKMMAEFGGEGSAGGDSALERAEARYEKLEKRYEKLEERMEKLEHNYEKLRDENAVLVRENMELKVKVLLLEAERGKPAESGCSGLFTQTL